MYICLKERCTRYSLCKRSVVRTRKNGIQKRGRRPWPGLDRESGICPGSDERWHYTAGQLRSCTASLSDIRDCEEDQTHDRPVRHPALYRQSGTWNFTTHTGGPCPGI